MAHDVKPVPFKVRPKNKHLSTAALPKIPKSALHEPDPGKGKRVKRVRKKVARINARAQNEATPAAVVAAGAPRKSKSEHRSNGLGGTVTPPPPPSMPKYGSAFAEAVGGRGGLPTPTQARAFLRGKNQD